MQKSIITNIEAIPRTVLFSLCLLCAAGLGVADYLTGDSTLLVFYFVPITCATWFVGRRAGLVISFVCAIELFTTDILFQMASGSFQSIRYWNSLMEMSFLLLTSRILFSLKVELEKNKFKTQELEAINIGLEAFNYSVAHDLRAPLTWIGGYSHLLLKRYADILDKQHSEFLKKIYEETFNMQQLIDALLDLAHAGHCDLSREMVDLSEMAHNIAADLMSGIAGRRVTFQVASDVTAVGDKRLLQVVLRNLLENAWKYSGQTAEAIIEFGMIQEGASQVYFVRDNGIGFAKEDAEKMFTPFKRLNGTSAFHGHGIGLATVYRIIQRHRGRVWSSGEVGKGATFYFTI